MIRLLRTAALAALLCVGLPGMAEDRPVPALTGRVVDETGTLAPGQVGALDAKLRAFEQAKGSQIAVLVTGTTFPEPIESFSIRVADAWKIGRKGVDDGILVVVAKSDRAMRLEVGYGLEGVVPDATAKRLIEEVFIPAFQQGDFYAGLDAGIDRLIRLIEGEPLPPPPEPSSRRDARSIESWLVMLVVATLAVGGVLRRLLGRLPGALVSGAGIGLLAWLLVGAMLAAVAAGIIAFLVTLLGGGMPGRYGGGFGGGGFGGGGFGGGGGFSGGGGGFGGGGASGRW